MAAAVEKKLVIAVEGTAALGPYWPTILADYLEKIVRSFCASELPGKKLEGAPPELALVVFHTHGPYNAFCVQRSRWTKDIDAFLSWLSGISFSGGGFSEAPTCEGLSEALMILHGSRDTTQNNQNHEAQKHCILVAASNLYPYHKENIGSSKELSIADAETVAKSFAQCSVSLSVISPKPLPTLKAIYNAGKLNPQAADPLVDHAKNPQFLVLLSENFMEARTALCRPLHGNLDPNQTLLKMDSAFAVTMPGPTTNANPSVNGLMIGRKPVCAGVISTATVKMEPATIAPMVSAPTFNLVPAMVPTPGMAQQAGVSSNAQQPPPKYAKIWEGTLSGIRQGQPVFICKLEGYRNRTAHETLAADWPETMNIVRLIHQEHMSNKKFVGKTDFLVFRSLNQHGFLGQLKEKKLCAVIQLPSQTLVLSMSERADHLIGILCPVDVMVSKPLVSNQEPPMLVQQQLQQQQIQQLQQQIQQLTAQLQQQQQQQQHMQMHRQTQAILLQQPQHQQQHQQMQQMQQHYQQMPLQQQQQMQYQQPASTATHADAAVVASHQMMQGRFDRRHF